MARFKDNITGQEISEAIVLSRYFRREGETTKEFAEELKQLDEAGKTELAIGAAKELGFEQVS